MVLGVMREIERYGQAIKAEPMTYKCQCCSFESDSAIQAGAHLCLPRVVGKCGQCGEMIFDGTDHLCPFQFRPNLRDQFAMAAPHEEIEECLLAGGEQSDIEAVCRARYEWSDAMLAARERKA